jgi:DNA-binding XRE family transcriptional regulator
MRDKLLLMKELMSKEVALSFANFGTWHDLRNIMVEAREAQGLTQADLAMKLGITQSAVSQFESLSGNPRLMTLIAYAQALNLKLTFDASSADAQ